MSLIKRLVCDYPECDSIKEDLIWWETSEEHPEKWRRTSNGLHWCWIHSEDEIQGAIYIMYQEGFPLNHTGKIPTVTDKTNQTVYDLAKEKP